MRIEEAIVYVLASSGHGMKTEQIAREINERKLFIRKGNIPVDGKMVYAVIMSHPDTFAKSEGRIRLIINIVISVGLFGHSGDDEVWTEGTKEMLDNMHKRKIDMADAIYVINVGGYIGESTRSEIDYATRHGKEILYLEPDSSL